MNFSDITANAITAERERAKEILAAGARLRLNCDVIVAAVLDGANPRAFAHHHEVEERARQIASSC